ncbi:DNA polymerase III subunit delta [Arenibaculum pallidiluteum]|uniref:DNA polymerase III subunit delta n=1 Tax=Arenibaculum pallidiluteum TaxID=2812559 RepID=UPI001A96A842|nr:DNA polymerase III subunit delta [Arenibaculum pallidiluteum]
MKLPANRIEAFLRRPDPEIRAVLVYGPDGGLVRERADLLARGVVPDLKDPFRIAELPADQLAKDKARLADEVAAMALTGGRRCVRVRGAEDTLCPVFAALLGDLPPGDTLVVVEAGDLGKGSKLRALFEDGANVTAIPCYVEDEGELSRTIAEMLRGAGKTAAPDALTQLAGSLVGDRLLARAEIEKLITYMGEEREVGLDDVRAVIGDSGAMELDAPVWAAADGDYAAVDRALARLYGEGESPVGILRAAQRHCQRLQLVVAQVARGDSLERAAGALKPPLFFKTRNQFLAQARRWTPAGLRQALDRLTEAEAECKRTGMPDRTLCARALYQVAALARGKGPR